MKINKVHCAEYGSTPKPILFDLESKDMSVDEYAELRFLSELCGLIDGNYCQFKPAKGNPGLFVALETENGLRSAHFGGELSDETAELVDFIKGLRQAHAFQTQDVGYWKNLPGASSLSQGNYPKH
jgi:hypothetical protein